MHAKARSVAAAAILSMAMAASIATPASADVGVKAGFLKCNVAGNLSFVVGSSRDISCIYDPGNGKPIDHYAGTIKKFGVDIGYQSNGVMIWGVIAPGGYIGPGSLAGDYGGASATVALGAGVGANVLVGGLRNTVSLQPLSVEGMQGLNVAGGVGALTLVPVQ